MIFYSLAILFSVSNVFISLGMLAELHRRKIPVRFRLMRGFIPTYVQHYRDVCVRRSGRAGILYAGWFATILLAAAFVLCGMFIKR